MKDLWLYLRISEHLDEGDTVLDVGCGLGGLTNFLVRTTKKKVIGLDISDYGFKKASREAKKMGTSDLIECVLGDAHRLGEHLGDRRFKAVTMTYTLHHLERPSVALGEVHKILEDDGRLILADFIVRKR